MPWHTLWPDFLKKRLCRYLLQHYLGHFFKEKISLEQLSIDIYNGTGCVKNLNLDCEALNEQLNAAAAATSNTSNTSTRHSSSTSPIPIEIVSGFVGYISVYIPWHDLFNDYCKLTIKNVQITIRTKQRKNTNSNSSSSFRRKSSFNSKFNDDDLGEDQLDLDEDLTDSNSNSMFSSMIVDSLMNTSIHIAQECLNDKSDDDQTKSDDEFNPINKTEKNSLLGLEAFASTIDSILSRIKINIEQIQIRIENLDTSMPKMNESNIMSSSAVFSNRPSNGIALELRIKSIKYFDLDSTNNSNSTNTKTDNQTKTDNTNTTNLRNTTKSFNIEGLTVYFDEFIVKDDPDINTDCLTMKPSVVTTEDQSDLTKSLNSTIDLSETSNTSTCTNDTLNRPQDESPPFTYDLNPDYYLYTNPIILITFSGIQSIKLTINNMRPTDLILEQTNSSGVNTAGQLDPNEKLQLQQQRPFLELNAQFGSIKCLASPKQIHLLIDMFTKLNDYIEAANATRKQFKSTNRNKLLKSKRLNKMSSIRGCDKRKFEALVQNDLLYQQNSIINETKDNDEEEEYEDKIGLSKLHDNETSVMFYSMMSESSAFATSSSARLAHHSPEYSPESKETDETTNTQTNDSDLNDDKQTQTLLKDLKQTIEQLQQDVIQTNSKNASNLFQTFKITFRMLSLTVLHHDPPVNQSTQSDSDGSTKRLLVERMKLLSDSYFDWVSTIDATTTTTSTSTGSIDKNTVLKYHQACAFNDHFLVLLKPINLNLVQKINQRFTNTNPSKRQSQIVQYSLNEISLAIGYIQVNEYLVAPTKIKPINLSNKRFKTTQVIEACQAATITEMIHFADSSNQSIEQPCLKVNLTTYEPLELVNSKLKQFKFNLPNSLMNNSFENIQISLNQSLICEIDISIIDRLYYLLNDTLNPTRSQPTPNTKTNKLDQMAMKMTRNFEIKCSQIIKIGLRFPIADWRRTQTQTQQPKTTTTSVISETQQVQPPQPVTLIAFRNLREQILTLHLFDFNFQTLLSNATNSSQLNDCLNLHLTSSQINAYYQYTKKDRPIHFGLIQQKLNEPRSLICSIKIPNNQEVEPLDVDCQLLTDQLMSEPLDSLKTHFNINISKPNRLYAHKEEENDPNELTEKEDDLEHKNDLINEDDDSDDEYSPFSRIHSLISSEKNRRIVNAGNKSEMQSFVNQSKQKSSTVIKLNIPQLKFLIADQKFLNDIYNCLLNDLIMWVPSPVAPIESQLIYDSNTSHLPSLNFLLENEYLANQLIEDKPQQFHMCRSAILKPQSSKSDSENSDYCESDDDQSKQKYKQQLDHLKLQQQQQLKQKKLNSTNNKNTLAFILNIDSAHLKAFVLNLLNSKETTLKYGEFDIKATNFQMCIAISESFKTDIIYLNNNKKTKPKQVSPPYKLEKQQISIFTDQINISHSTKQCPPNVTQLKYPTNYSSFETLFQMSKTKDLITVNDPSIVKSLFQSESGSQSNLVSVPMVSIGIKSKFNLKKNTKQLLVALNFNNLSLHHLFCVQTDYWIFQLIQLFDLIDIEILGYEAPIVLTELHLNVANSCILYKPVYLATNSLIAFKSLHWSSNVTAESSLTLLVFNIEDIYLFLSRLKQPTDIIDLKKDYICVANSDLFELRLLICDEQPQQQEKRKSPILDIKIRSNLIQLRTCVDSAFTLIELINYIVSDGDLHQPNLILSEFMSSNPISTQQLPSIPSNHTIEMQPDSDVISTTPIITTNIIQAESLQPSSANLSKAITNASTSIPILQHSKQSTVFTVGTPPPSTSFKSSSSSASLSQQQLFFSPLKSQSPDLINQKTQPIGVPLPSPSLSFVNQANNSFNAPSSAESLISDMVKEAMHSNPMTQSIYGSLPVENESGSRKRNPSLTLLSPDLQTKRLISQSFMLNNCDKLNTLKETTSNLSSSNSEDEDDDEPNNKINFMKELQKKANEQNEDEDDDDECLIASIHFNHKMNQKKKNKLSDEEDDENNSDYSENTMNKSNEQDDEDEFHFDLPFSNISPMIQQQQRQKLNQNETVPSKTSQNVSRQLTFDKNNRILHFKPSCASDDEDSCSNYANKNINQDDDDENEDEELLRDFDIIDVIPGFGEPPRNNQDFEIKILRRKSLNSQIVIKEDHFKKPLTKIDVLKAPDSYPCPLNVYCIQEISLNWSLYGGSDFSQDSTSTLNETVSSSSSAMEAPAPTKMNRTVSSPIIVTQSVSPMPRSRNSSTSSNSLSMSPQLQNYQSPSNQSPSSIKFSKTGSINYTKQEKYLQRKAGGRIAHKYDTNSLNWLARGGKSRNLDVCMEIALYKVKTKIDMYSDMNDLDETVNKENKLTPSSRNESPYLYRVALAIGDIEIRDKLASSPFNMFLFRYESEHCPKHTNSNMLFVKFLCSKSMDSQRLIECDIKVSIQPLRFNIDQDAIMFLGDFFNKLASKDLNEFSKSLIPPPPPPIQEDLTSEQDTTSQQLPLPPQTPQQVFIRNFIFSPDLLVRFDFSGKYDTKSDTKMDTLTKLIMVAIQLSNTEIKLKRICYRRGFLGAEKLLTALIKEWVSDIQRNQMKNIIKGWGIFNSLIQFFEGFTYLVWYPIEQYRKDGRVLCGIQKGSAAFSTCTVLATIELTNRMFQATKNVAEFFYDLVTPHRANTHHLMSCYGSNLGLVDTILTGVGHNRNIRLRRHPNDIREGLTNAYYVMYEGMNETAANLMQEINQGAEHKGLPGAIGGALRQLPSTALAPIVLTTEATCNILSGIRNQLKPDEKRDDDQKWKTIAFNS